MSIEEKIKQQIKKIGYNENFDIEIINSKDTAKREKYVNFLFKKLQIFNHFISLKYYILDNYFFFTNYFPVIF